MNKFLTGLQIALLMIFIAVPVVSYAQQEELDIQSDNLDINNQDGTAVFTNNVVVAREGMKLKADKVKVTYIKESIGNHDVDKIEATGHVKLLEGGRVATAQRALYKVQEHQVHLFDDVEVTQGDGSVIKGTKMLYDIKQGRITVSSGDEPVRAHFNGKIK